MDAPSDLGSPGAAPTPDPPERPGPRRLRRRPDDGHIAGVCAGVAEYFDVDPMLVRIAAVVLLISGPGVVAYVLAWIFVPAEPGLARYGEPQSPIDGTDRATQIFGIVLLGLGVSVIWGDWWSPLRGWLFPLGLMALGGWLLLRPDRDGRPPPSPPVPPMPPVPPTPAWSGPGPSVTDAPTPSTDDPVIGVGGDPGSFGDLTGDTTAVHATTDSGVAVGGGAPPPTAPWDMPPSPVPPAPVQGGPHEHHRRHRHLVGPGVFGVLLVWAGMAWLTGVGLTTTLAVGLVILGLGFVIGSFVGGSRALVIPAILVAVALGLAAFIDIPLTGPIGEQHWSPVSRADLEDEYAVSMGEGTLDLSELGVVRAETSVRMTVGLGHLVVLVPEDQDVFVNTEVGAGEAWVFGEEQNGVGFETHEGYPGRGGTLILDLEVGMGQIEVRRVSSDAEAEPVEELEPEAGSTTSTLG